MSANTDRPLWDDYFLGIAEAVAARGDCRRRKFGAVLVSAERRIISTGYVGAPSGMPGCLDGACPRGLLSDAECAPYSSYDSGPGACISVHAEANALLYARESATGSTLYLWSDGSHAEPCPGCLRMLLGAGVSRWVATARDMYAVASRSLDSVRAHALMVNRRTQ